MIFFLATYLLPLVGMGLCYIQMGLSLWGTGGQLIEQQTIDLEKSKKNKKMVLSFFFFSNIQLFEHKIRGQQQLGEVNLGRPLSP